jgi:hypothetical protein
MSSIPEELFTVFLFRIQHVASSNTMPQINPQFESSNRCPVYRRSNVTLARLTATAMWTMSLVYTIATRRHDTPRIRDVQGWTILN